MRELFLGIVEMRRQDFKNPDFQDKGDLLTILLNDELFRDNETLIIDECLTFYFAGSQTTGLTTSNMILFMMQQPNLFQDIRKEIQD